MHQGGPARDAVAAIERDGFAVLDRVLSGDVLARVREEVRILVEASPFGDNEFDGFKTRRAWAVLANSRAFDAFVSDGVVLEVVESLLGPTVQFGLSIGVQIHPGEVAQRLHFDQGLYPVPREHDVLVTTIWALDDFSAENGATRLVPGSHLRPARPIPEPAATIPAEMAAGSVLVYSGRLFHGGGPNGSDAPRLGVIIDFIAPWLRPAEAHTLAIDHDVARGLSPKMQELLGFNQPNPYFGFVGGRHPREWLVGGD